MLLEATTPPLSPSALVKNVAVGGRSGRALWGRLLRPLLTQSGFKRPAVSNTHAASVHVALESCRTLVPLLNTVKRFLKHEECVCTT